MEYNKKGGESSHQGRRDYDKRPAGKPSGRKHFTTTRKTSPEHGAERVFTTDRAYDSTDRPVRRFDGERRPYDGERRSFDGERRPYDGERRPYDGERRRFDGERKPYDRERRSFDGDRRNFHQGQGPRKPGRKPQAPKSGIDAMISRRPQVDRNAYSDNDQQVTLAFDLFSCLFQIGELSLQLTCLPDAACCVAVAYARATCCSLGACILSITYQLFGQTHPSGKILFSGPKLCLCRFAVLSEHRAHITYYS